jgi:hypothetical protein
MLGLFQKGAIKLDMTGPSGKKVSPTELGATYGVSFDRIPQNPAAISPASHMTSVEIRGAYDPRDNAQNSSGSLLPSAEELFKMKAPGIYTLKIQVQAYVYMAIGTNPPASHFIRFQPVQLKIEKPED